MPLLRSLVVAVWKRTLAPTMRSVQVYKNHGQWGQKKLFSASCRVHWFTLEALARETQMMRYASNRKIESSTIANNGSRKGVLINGALRRRHELWVRYKHVISQLGMARHRLIGRRMSCWPCTITLGMYSHRDTREVTGDIE